MMNIGIVEWLDEHNNGEYPMDRDIGLRNFIVDAHFIQFDGFVPVLVSVDVQPTKVVLVIEFDKETKEVTINYTPITYSLPVRMYGTDGRYMGMLTIGPGFNNLITDNAGSKYVLNVPFAATTVLSVNSQNGVYSIQGVAANPIVIKTGTTPLDMNIQLGIVGTTITWNAVAIPRPATPVIVALKSLNSIVPVNNNINIFDTDVVKITPGIGLLTFELVSTIANDNIGPTTNYA